MLSCLVSQNAANSSIIHRRKSSLYTCCIQAYAAKHVKCQIILLLVFIGSNAMLSDGQFCSDLKDLVVKRYTSLQSAEVFCSTLFMINVVQIFLF